MKISRMWAMPSHSTFSIKPIKELVSALFHSNNFNVDPFVGHSPFKSQCLSNDLNPEIPANYHIDAIEFLKTCLSESADLILFDPPFSQRQVSEHYKQFNKTVNMQTTQTSYWGNLKKEIGRIIKPDGYTVSCGWNSGGIGMCNNMTIVEILLVPHGTHHNDTIVTIERKI